MSRIHRTAGIAALLGASLWAGAGLAQQVPPAQSWTAYDTGSSGFNIAVAVGQMLKTKSGSDVRVLPAGNDTARLNPLKAGRANISAMGIGSYFAQEGVYEFGGKDWGPQPIRLLLSTISCNGLSLGVAKDTGVKEIKDLKGKRIAAVVGSPALTQNAFAILAFGGLTPADVKIVEFSSNNAMWKGVINNEADAGFSSTISGQTRELDASPRGVTWPATPTTDKAGWDRLMAKAPFFVPHKATCGSGGVSKDTPIVMPTYPYPIFMSYADQPADQIYGVVKSMLVNYADYKDAAPGADGLEAKQQNVTWVIPYHDGAIRALKEAGVWTDAAQKHNDALLKRQEVLAAAWKAFVATNVAEDKFATAWVTARADALKKAGMPAVFE
jgi:TRAP transporter TAXI family solute receptor